MGGRIHIIIVLLLVLLSGCRSESFDTKEQLWSYLSEESNGYHFTKNINGIDYKLTYKPTDLLVMQESFGDSFSRGEIELLRDKYKGHLYFNLGMAINGKEILTGLARNKQEFGFMVNLLAFNMSDKLNLITSSNDTIAMVDYVYPRMYGLGQSTDMLLIFEKPTELNKEEYLRLTIADLGFRTGEVAFKMETDKIINQPRLKL